MFIDGFGISNYKSFGNDLQRIGPFNKINLFIGANNSGKSNILSFLSKIYNETLKRDNANINLGGIDQHLGNSPPITSPSFELAITLDNPILRDIASSIQNSNGKKIFNNILHAEQYSQHNAFWIRYKSSNNKYSLDDSFLTSMAHSVPLTHWRELLNNLNNPAAGAARDSWIPETISVLTRHLTPHEVAFIPAFRKIGERNSTPNDYSGIGIIERLAQLQNPDHNRQDLKIKFNDICKFVKTVLDNPSAEIEIPRSGNTITIHMDGKPLPIESLGTGIHEVIIIAAACTVIENQVICMEEPEIHLHPILQKKLIKYLTENTSNQYFITTHSAHLMDTPEAAIFHTQYRNGQTYVSPVQSDTDKFSICNDLGYHASDLLQANSIIWVEGPSDRIYLNHWIKNIAPDLVEGIHYSIMFYGGRLLSHLTANDTEIDKFISLRRLNRNVAILIDSDKDSANKHLNATKKRIRDEFDKETGFVWITKGREIENYIQTDTLQTAATAIKNGFKIKKGQFDNCLKKGDKSLDKVKVALKVVELENTVNLDMLDLKANVNNLITFIKDANP